MRQIASLGNAYCVNSRPWIENPDPGFMCCWAPAFEDFESWAEITRAGSLALVYSSMALPRKSRSKTHKEKHRRSEVKRVVEVQEGQRRPRLVGQQRANNANSDISYRVSYSAGTHSRG